MTPPGMEIDGGAAPCGNVAKLKEYSERMTMFVKGELNPDDYGFVTRKQALSRNIIERLNYHRNNRQTELLTLLGAPVKGAKL